MLVLVLAAMLVVLVVCSEDSEVLVVLVQAVCSADLEVLLALVQAAMPLVLVV